MKRACVSFSARRLPLIRARLSRRGFRHFRSALLAYRVETISGGVSCGRAYVGVGVDDTNRVFRGVVLGPVGVTEGEVDGTRLPIDTHISHLDSWDHPTAPAPLCASGCSTWNVVSRCSTSRNVSRTTGLVASASGKRVVSVCSI